MEDTTEKEALTNAAKEKRRDPDVLQTPNVKSEVPVEAFDEVDVKEENLEMQESFSDVAFREPDDSKKSEMCENQDGNNSSTNIENTQNENHDNGVLKAESQCESSHPTLLTNGSEKSDDPYSFEDVGVPPVDPVKSAQPYKPKKPRKPKKQRSDDEGLPPATHGDFERKPLEDRSTTGSGSDSIADDEEDRLVIAEDENSAGSLPSAGDVVPDKKEKISDHFKAEKPRRKHNRFNGMSEEEVAKRLLPDLITPGLDILIIGINPGMYAAYKGHHYAGPGNHFWKCMFLSGLVPHPMTADDDYKLLEFGIGFTNIVERTTRGSNGLSKKEIAGGTQVLIDKIKNYRPKIAVFNGKGIYEIFSGKKDFHFGKQPDVLDGTDTHIWVMPNSSARCAQLPRAVDKVPFYAALKKFRDFLTGAITEIDDAELVFSHVKLKNFNENSALKKSAAAAAAAAQDSDQGGEVPLGPDGLPIEGMDYRVDPITGKKRRGRPPKPRPDGTVPPPKRRRVDADGNPIPRGSNPIDPLTGKKKRGRPKKSDLPVQPAGAVVVKPKQTVPKRESMDSDSFASGSSSTEADSKTALLPPMQPLPPFSPNFGRSSMGDLVPKNEDEKDFDEEKVTANGGEGDPTPMCNYTNSSRDPVNPSYYPDYPSAPPPPTGDQYPPSAYIPPPDQGSGPPMEQPQPPPPPPPPIHQPFVDTQQRKTVPNESSDVTSKSITGLESLVDQIPAMAENDSGVFSGSGAGSHPNTPRSVGPYSPATAGTAGQFSSFHPFPAATVSPAANHFVPSTSDSFTNSESPSTNYASASPTTPNNFSVSSLVQQCSSSSTNSEAPQQQHPSDSFSVSSLTSSSYGSDMAGKYHGLPSTTNPYMTNAGMFGSSSFGASGFLGQAGIGANSYLGSSHMGNAMGMGAMTMGMSPMASYYGQYPGAGTYGSPAGAPSYPYPHGLHVPNPSYPYPSPYGQSPYSQSPYF